VAELKAGGYNPRARYDSNAELREVLDGLAVGEFSRGEVGLFRPLVDSLLGRDEYCLLADYQSYVDCQDRVGDAWNDQERWNRMSIMNTARSAQFSSDRTIREYCAEIWNLPATRVPRP
jgi:starch phosphorylase